MGIIGGAILAAVLAIKFHKKIEEMIALSLLLFILLIYAFGLMGHLTLGLYFTIGIMIVSLGYLIYLTIKDRKNVRTSLLTWGSLAFCIYLVFFFYYSHNRCLNHPDEFYCWGLMAKGYYYFQKLFSDNATAMSGDHPPFMPLINYFSMMTWREYSDSISFFGNSVLKISLLLPVFAHVKSKMTAPKFLGMLVLLPLFHVLSGLEGFDHILADGLIALLLCYFMQNVLAHIETKDKLYYVSALASLLAICLSKRLGFLFAALAIVCITAIYSKKMTEWYVYLGGYAVASSLVCLSWFKFQQGIFLVPIIALIGAMFLNVVFEKTIKLRGSTKQIVIIVEAFAVAGAVFIFCVGYLGRIGAYSYAVMARLCEDLFTIKSTGDHIILSYGIFMVVALLFVAYLKQYQRGKYLEINYITFFTVVSMCLYLLAMLTIHIKSIGPYRDYIEGLIQRYLIPWEIVVIFLIFLALVIYNEKSSYLHVLVAFILLLLISNASEFYRGIFFKHYAGDYSAFEKAGVEINSGDMIYFIDEEPVYGYSDREFFYTMFPARTNFIYDMMNDNNGPIECTVEELSNEIAEKYNYVYIQSIDDDFELKYGTLFDNPDEIKEKSVYEVEREGKKVSLKLIS
ncbi:hypothetical protein SAMN02745247_02790 [Butyrivibrio hungatei DSM 14810]|uniref:Dolichyl-phosphate-mannose-protein mannosyltransferase n=1 Tax=Butyrivibrio hungatei DSM 14810 TaxID=1121132 RepID=A0A1M7T0N0_9FIRM|nr:hypothetical protein [Butyrivibrio hungatei]SHN64325.1 hypothetical protein SAMN02745247_02790 [Butyrivibrio hungatei DSM 14810]